MLTQQEKSDLCKKALIEEWGITATMRLWQPLGFKDAKDMADNILGMQSQVVIPQGRIMFQSDIIRHWLEYQYAAIDGRIEVAKQVSQDNIFRAMLAI